MNPDDIAEMIAELIAEGHSPREAAKIASSVAKTSPGGTSLARRQADEESLTRSPILDRRNSVDYGNETPAQALERWLEQERNDPQGVYAGGATSGGIFGGDTVTLQDYDPAAFQRTMGAFERAQALQVQAETLKVLKQLKETKEEPAPRRLLSSFTNRLGRKRDR